MKKYKKKVFPEYCPLIYYETHIKVCVHVHIFTIKQTLECPECFITTSFNICPKIF